MDPKRLMTRSIRQAQWGEKLARILAAALDAVDPEEAVFTTLRRQGDQLIVQNQTYNLNKFQRILVVGAGKAGAPMMRATAQNSGRAIDQRSCDRKGGLCWK